MQIKKKRRKAENHDSKPVFAFVALREDVIPKWDSICEIFKNKFSSTPEFFNIEEAENQISGCIEGGIFSIAFIPAPIPWADLEGPCETAWYWPEAKDQMRQHKTHLLITLMAAKLDIIDSNLLLTELIAAAALAADAPGIYWGTGTLVHSCDTFMNFSEGMSRSQLPLYNWIDFRVNQGTNGNYTLFTTGMNQFDLMEIEIVNSELSPENLIDKAFNIGHYLLDNGPILCDGDTIGMTETEKIKIKYEPSIWNKAVKVYKLYV